VIAADTTKNTTMSPTNANYHSLRCINISTGGMKIDESQHAIDDFNIIFQSNGSNGPEEGPGGV
jgi:hypothetical protein